MIGRDTPKTVQEFKQYALYGLIILFAGLFIFGVWKLSGVVVDTIPNILMEEVLEDETEDTASTDSRSDKFVADSSGTVLEEDTEPTVENKSNESTTPTTTTTQPNDTEVSDLAATGAGVVDGSAESDSRFTNTDFKDYNNSSNASGYYPKTAAEKQFVNNTAVFFNTLGMNYADYYNLVNVTGTGDDIVLTYRDWVIEAEEYYYGIAGVKTYKTTALTDYEREVLKDLMTIEQDSAGNWVCKAKE